QEMGLAHSFGAALASRIERAFQTNQVTFNVILGEVEQIQAELENITTNLTNLVNALRFLRLERNSLAPGEFEVAIAIPRAAVDNEFGQLGSEFRKLDQIVGVFTELATGSRERTHINALSTSDLTAFLAVLPQVAVAIADALQRAIALYASVLGL